MAIIYHKYEKHMFWFPVFLFSAVVFDHSKWLSMPWSIFLHSFSITGVFGKEIIREFHRFWPNPHIINVVVKGADDNQLV